MAPARVDEPPVSWPAVSVEPTPYNGPPRNVEPISKISWDDSLQPKKYNIFGTHPDSKILFLDVNILDSTGREPYRGDVFIEGERFSAVGDVPNLEHLKAQPGVRVFHGKGRTLMSGLGDGHTHFSWNGGDLDQLGTLGVEEHTLLTMRSAQCFLDSGYTMCFGAASAKERLDVVIRDAINAGDIPGPRYLANGKEMARRGGELVGGITAFADGPDEMRQVIKHHVGLGVDSIKLSISGEEITEIRSAQDCYFTDEEMAACVDEAHKHGKRLCTHARARDSVTMSVKHGVEAIFHASYIDDVGMDMLEKAKTKHVVVPAINWLICTLYEAEAFGYPKAVAEKVGYKRELEAAIAGLREMHRRGIVVLPGGDYGFAWTPHGTYARDLEHFTTLLGFTAHEAIIAATAGVAAQFMQSLELGKVQPGYYADCILVDGNPLEEIAVLQNHDKLNVICINGRVHKAGLKEYVPPPIAGEHNDGHIIVPDGNFPAVSKAMQIQSKLY
ncbi:isoaspartyl dipeptidase-like protein [Paraphoma chrysanthemicola]|nr:isoaspartyl dipeptidase-like protein [Paraphoma chrysanthemicola]